MTRRSTGPGNSTNVRLFIVVLAALLVTGCGTVAPLGSELQPNRKPGPVLCESFGPETRCSHADAARVARALDRFNQSGQLGFRGW